MAEAAQPKRNITDLTKDELDALVDRLNDVLGNEFGISEYSIDNFWRCLEVGSYVPHGKSGKCSVPHDIDEICDAEIAIEASKDETGL